MTELQFEDVKSSRRNKIVKVLMMARVPVGDGQFTVEITSDTECYQLLGKKLLHVDQDDQVVQRALRIERAME